MRLFNRLAQSSLAALFVVALPFAQAQAEECVTFNGINHCGMGKAQLRLNGKELQVVSPYGAAEDGVAIFTEGSTVWSAGFRSQPSGQGVEQTVLTGESEGAAASTATLRTEGGRTSYAATFTAATPDQSTYTATVYSQGQRVASVSGVRYGDVGVTQVPGRVISGITPTCTNQGYSACMASCTYANCNYCTVPCRRTFHRLELSGACVWSMQVERANFQLAQLGAAAQVVEGDMVELTEEIDPSGSYPYVNFDRILVQSTAKVTTLTDVQANGNTK
ncbi:hypothetical protein D7Y13_09885 [Corallococcus praedator]|uniref:DUF5666 domain-containing protein n=1 Tax=Corallococcus praedator TaxID=2316724 RepID=A0ABX9QL86_9BACT|nr:MULTISPECIES: hypothetical protein [Corallococcus]RKH11447.1 hypothetical protein D7X74_25500 [Corallococcus sp. CA047B]RKH31269.1 hypothetical protein D7X75_19825 [Corallococcus sp. CA031C]RKI12173.1 hypothetical protein D7Y13_09885 [Corallococcus praedator]